MKNGKYLPFLALFLGLVCAGARWTLFRNHTDALSLLETGTYAELCVWLLTGLCLVLFALAVLDGFFPPVPSEIALVALVFFRESKDVDFEQ